MIDRDEVLRRVDLAALLDQLSPAPPYRMGRALRWRCIDPNHEDARPSVTMFVDQRGIGRWKCWSGGHGGTAIDALVVARGMTVGGALDELALGAGVATVSEPCQPDRALVPKVTVQLDSCVIRYVEACERILWTPTGRRVLRYLVEERGLDPEVLRVNRVGADPGPDVLRRPSGLPRGGVAAVLPALSCDGAITYAQARYLVPPEGRSKYDNPSSRLCANPRLGWVSPGVPAQPQIVVCEGIIDALTVASNGHSAAAVLGATYVSAHLAQELIDGAAGRPMVVLFDRDAAGDAAADRLASLLGGHATVKHLDPALDANASSLRPGGLELRLA
jgi:DNA primase